MPSAVMMTSHDLSHCLPRSVSKNTHAVAQYNNAFMAIKPSTASAKMPITIYWSMMKVVATLVCT